MIAPRYVAVRKADEAFGLAPGMCAWWVHKGLLRRVFFQDHGEIVVGVRSADVVRVVARARACQIARAGVGTTPVR